MIEQLYTQPPENSWVVCLDEMGPESAKSYRGQRVVKAPIRATQEADYGRRGKGYVFGAFRPASGAALTHTYTGRTTVNWVDFLLQVDAPTLPGKYSSHRQLVVIAEPSVHVDG